MSIVRKKSAISVRGMQKWFKIYSRPSDILMETLTGKARHTEFRALQEINLEVERGSSVGIMGRNGAGKSTLLKVITGALTQTEGEVIVNGSVTAILELGTGFHPEYTGRDNVYMGGMCLGMSRRQIDQKFDEIIAFAELEDFIDQPFRTYSSGMQARLTFSVALAPDPDILIIDEALSVGDARFQQKCYAHMHKLRDQGKTFLLVSHDEGAIASFCDQAIIMDGGRIVFQGSPQQAGWTYQKILFGAEKYGKVPAKHDEQDTGASSKSQAIDNVFQPDEFESVDQYERDQSVQTVAVSDGNLDVLNLEERAGSTGSMALENDDAKSSRYGNKQATIIDFGIRDEDGNKCTRLLSGKRYNLFMKIRANSGIDGWSGGFAIRDRRGLLVFGITTLSKNITAPTLSEGEEITCQSDCVMWLAEGTYFLTLGLAESVSGEKIDFIENAVIFNVIGPGGIFTTSFVNLEAGLQILSGSEEKQKKAIIGVPGD